MTRRVQPRPLSRPKHLRSGWVGGRRRLPHLGVRRVRPDGNRRVKRQPAGDRKKFPGPGATHGHVRHLYLTALFALGSRNPRRGIRKRPSEVE